MSKFAALPTTNAKTAWGVLAAVVRIAEENPRRINMNFVCYRGLRLLRTSYCLIPEGVPDCGTVGCVAGWVDVLTGKTSKDEDNWSNTEIARKTLGLSDEQAEELFYPRELMRFAPQTPAYVAKVKAHIFQFMRKNERQLKMTLLPAKGAR